MLSGEEIKYVILELKKETDGLVRQLENGIIIPSDILKVLFDYNLFEPVSKGDYDDYIPNEKLKRRCGEYISICDVAREEIEKALSPSNIARRVQSQREKMVYDTQDLTEYLRQFSEKSKMDSFKGEEEAMKTYSALAKRRRDLVDDILRYIENKIRADVSKKAPIDLPELRTKDGKDLLEAELDNVD